MKSIGVLRRIDDLGRIVIPKEIRNNLKINSGESMEIFVNGDSIVLKKYSYMSDLCKIAQNYSDSFYDVIKKDIIITDLNKIIAVSGGLSKKYLDKEINNELIDLIKTNNIIINNKMIDLVISNGKVEKCYNAIVPIIVSGTVMGSVIILSNKKIDELVEKVGLFIAKLLCKHLE